jgi:hypothetical protein
MCGHILGGGAVTSRSTVVVHRVMTRGLRDAATLHDCSCAVNSLHNARALHVQSLLVPLTIPGTKLHGGFYCPYIEVPDPQNFLNFFFEVLFL